MNRMSNRYDLIVNQANHVQRECHCHVKKNVKTTNVFRNFQLSTVTKFLLQLQGILSFLLFFFSLLFQTFTLQGYIRTT